MNTEFFAGHAVAKSLLPPAAYTATGNDTAVDMTAYRGGALVTLHSAAAGAGTNPTLDVKLQSSATSGGTYADIPGAAFAQVTNAASIQTLMISVDSNQPWIRSVHTIGGTASPSFTAACSMAAVAE